MSQAHSPYEPGDAHQDLLGVGYNSAASCLEQVLIAAPLVSKPLL